MTARRGGRAPLAAVLAANAISITGNALTLIGVPWFALQTTGSPGKAGLVAFCATLPVVVSALAGGPVIDRVGRRRVSIASDLVCALALAAIPVLHRAGRLDFWVLCLLMAVTGLFHAPGETARHVLVPDLAERAGTTLTRAASLFDAVSRGARMTGAALAGVLIAVMGAETVLLLDAATFGVSALLILAGVRGVAAAEPRKQAAAVSFADYRAQLREGYAFVLRTRLLLAVVVLVMLTNGLNQGWSAVLLPVHAQRHLGGAGAIGLITAVFGGCALLGALLYAAAGHRFRRLPVFTVAFLLGGAPRYVVAGLTDGLWPLVVAAGVSGLAVGTLNPILTTVLYERVPDALRSRVSGVTTAGVLLAAPLCGVGTGYLVEGAGPVAALLGTGALYFLVTLAPALFPSWRQMDRPPPLSSSGPSSPAPAPSGTPPRP